MTEDSPALYIVADTDGRIRWLGKAGGARGVAGRMRRHLTDAADPWKREVFDRVIVAPAKDSIPRPQLLRCEGWAAHALCLRLDLVGRVWPAAPSRQLTRTGPR